MVTLDLGSRIANVRLGLSPFAMILLALCASKGVAQIGPRLTYVSGSTTKVEQLIGDKDWGAWFNGVLTPTTSLTATNADVLGTDLGYSFSYNGGLIFLFGDTIGASSAYSSYINFTNPYLYHAGDTFATSNTVRGEDALLLKFYMNPAVPGTGLSIQPQYSDGSYLPMGGDDVPNCGITLGSQIYLICTSGADGSLSDSHQNSYSVLTTFNPNSLSFTAGRTISQENQGGHFVTCVLHTLPNGLPDDPRPYVLMYGEGNYRNSNIYLAAIPQNSFSTGAGTRYFRGFTNGQPAWSTSESNASAVVVDNPLGNNLPTVGNMSVAYSSALKLWLMTYDGGRGSNSTNGIYLTYANSPWGPWSKPQMIFNGQRDNGFGNFMYFYNSNTGQGSGPAGPTINLVANPPTQTRGANYAPYMIEPFLEVNGSYLTIYYTMATWNPYTVVKMKSQFLVMPAPIAIRPPLKLK